MLKNRRSKRTPSPIKKKKLKEPPPNEEDGNQNLQTNNNDDVTKKKKKGRIKSKLHAFRAATLQSKLLRRHKRLTGDKHNGNETKNEPAQGIDEAMAHLLTLSQKRTREMDSSLGSAFRTYVGSTNKASTSSSFESRYASSYNKNKKSPKRFSPTFGLSRKSSPTNTSSEEEQQQQKQQQQQNSNSEEDDNNKNNKNSNNGTTKEVTPRRRRSKRNRNPLLGGKKKKSTKPKVAMKQQQQLNQKKDPENLVTAKLPSEPPATTRVTNYFFGSHYWNPSKDQGGVGDMSDIEEEDVEESGGNHSDDGDDNDNDDYHGDFSNSSSTDDDEQKQHSPMQIQQQQQQQLITKKNQSHLHHPTPPSLVVVDPFFQSGGAPNKEGELLISPLEDTASHHNMPSPRKSEKKKRLKLSDTPPKIGFSLSSNPPKEEEEEQPSSKQRKVPITATAFGSDEELSVTTTTSAMLLEASSGMLHPSRPQQESSSTTSSVSTTGTSTTSTQKSSMYLWDARMRPPLIGGILGIVASVCTILWEGYALFMTLTTTTSTATTMDDIGTTILLDNIHSISKAQPLTIVVVAVSTVLCGVVGLRVLFQRRHLLDMSNEESLHEELCQDRIDLEHANTHLRSRQIGATAAMERHSRDIIRNHRTAAAATTTATATVITMNSSNNSARSINSSGSIGNPSKTRTTVSANTITKDYQNSPEHSNNSIKLAQLDVSRLVAVWQEQRRLKAKIQKEQKKQVLVSLTKALLLTNRRRNASRGNAYFTNQENIANIIHANRNITSSTSGPALNQIGITLLKARLPPGVTMDETQMQLLIQSKGPHKAVLELYRTLVSTSQEEEHKASSQTYKVFRFE